ncbi:hypothetical protein NMY22_g5401 [Coprinellus aureogranulatus]|nr:hypothetical protein NMY22_g5401 [Coprinellus aureogranulatus]
MKRSHGYQGVGFVQAGVTADYEAQSSPAIGSMRGEPSITSSLSASLFVAEQDGEGHGWCMFPENMNLLRDPSGLGTSPVIEELASPSLLNEQCRTNSPAVLNGLFLPQVTILAPALLVNHTVLFSGDQGPFDFVDSPSWTLPDAAPGSILKPFSWAIPTDGTAPVLSVFPLYDQILPYTPDPLSNLWSVHSPPSRQGF